MNGPHDLGGLHGLGPVAPEPDEPVFHADWERRIFGLTLAVGLHGRWSIDESRHTRENRHPVDYLGSGYYELWVKALETLVVRHGFVTPAEIAAGKAGPSTPERPPHAPGEVAAMLRRGFSTRLPDPVPPRFAVGDKVRVREISIPGHTRVPRYCRGRRGTVERDHGVFVFPDTNAHGKGKAPQHVYTVRFAAQELWGDTAEPSGSVYVDLWDSYLEPAP